MGEMNQTPPVVSEAWRRRQFRELLDQLREWEQHGLDLLAEVLELTEEGDELARAVNEVIRRLKGK